MNSILPEPYKVSYVVKNIENAKKKWQMAGFSEWTEFDYEGKKEDITIGEPFVAHFAQARINNGLVFELIQPVSGNSIWKQQLDEKGEGYHLISFSTPNNWKETVEKLKTNGAKVKVEANFDGLMWCYIDIDGINRIEVTEEKVD